MTNKQAHWFKKLWTDEPLKSNELPTWARKLFDPDFRKKQKQMKAAMKQRQAEAYRRQRESSGQPIGTIRGK
jgi:hypothetical protein